MQFRVNALVINSQVKSDHANIDIKKMTIYIGQVDKICEKGTTI